MKIGIDLDGVVFDTEREFRNDAEYYDMTEIKREGIIDSQEVLVQERYNWTEEEMQTFVEQYFIDATKRSSLIPGAKRFIELLQNDGHEFVVITARGLDLKEMEELGKKILKDNNIKFDKEYWCVTNKVEICQKENIDLMIEDNYHNAENIAKAGFKTIYLRDANLREIDHQNVKTCSIWGEIYRYIKEIEK